jgi:hypothetical protein
LNVRRPSIAVSLASLAVVGVLAVPALAGCDKQPADPAASVTADPPAPGLAGHAPAPTDPLPAPETLTTVLDKLADPSVPGAKKVSLVEGATEDDAAKLDKFTKALTDSGYLPLTFTATDIAWSDTVPGNVTTTVTVHSQNPAMSTGFTFPMEFRPYFGTWQMSRKTADMLLALGATPTTSPAPTPTP